MMTLSYFISEIEILVDFIIEGHVNGNSLSD